VKAGARVFAAGALILGGNAACGGSLNADANAKGANASASAEAEALADSGSGSDLKRTTSGVSLAADAPGSSRVLLGARHDLKLNSSSASISCQCLSVALGGAHAGAMRWSAVPPQLDDATQLTIALSSEGVGCNGEPKDSLGASYWGYRIAGNDVVVLVESARGGHPLTSGAVIPRPVGSGQVFVAPASKKLPYGRALDGAGQCKIGNPGTPRSSGFTQLELGSDDAPPVRSKHGSGSGNGPPAVAAKPKEPSGPASEVPSN
jgi:hypothetical protein